MMAISLTLLCPALSAHGVVVAYNTYQTPPFVLNDGQQGLAADLVSYLNQRLAGQYIFELQNVPRTRLLNGVLSRPAFNGVVLFLSPRYVDDLEQTRYHWSPPFMEDGGVFVFRTSQPASQTRLETLAGLRFGGVVGHHYPSLEARLGRDLQRIDARSEQVNLQNVQLGRIDFTLLAESTFLFFSHTENFDQLQKVDSPEGRFGRHFLVSLRSYKLGMALDRVARSMPQDPVWKAILVKYHLN